MDADFDSQGRLVAGPSARLSAGAFEAQAGDLKGYIRGRILPDLPYRENFESFELKEASQLEPGVQFAHPPLPWIGGRFKWEVRSLNGDKVLAKTLDRILFQRAITFIGADDLKNYTVQADVLSEGNKRMMSNVGVINQRYIVALIGNWQQLEVSSNQDRVKVAVPFAWKPSEWYRIKTRVDVSPDGSGVVRAKAWKRDEPEPAAWTIEVPHKNAHQVGATGGVWLFPSKQVPRLPG